MDTSTRLRGHGLLSEGKPYIWGQGDEEDAPSWHRAGSRSALGHGVCSCGATSAGLLESDGARKRWHREHKEAVRAGTTAPEAGKD